jgi:zinc-binding alcohol dehydrogenase/oxidoreductase
MKALIYTGNKEKIVDFVDKSKPAPGAGQVLVKMTAAALNHRDQWMRVGKYPGLQAGVTLGSDGCGVVEEVGEGVDSGLVGNEVIINPNNNWGPDPKAQSLDYHILGMPQDGTFAEYLLVNQDRVQHKPAHLGSEQAAALPLGGMTAFRACFTQANVNKDSKVLITGIGGGVALFALQFCTAVGAKVYVSSSSNEKIDKAVGLGAIAGFNYKEETWTKEANKEVGGFDAVIDSAGGDAINNYLKVVKPGGTIVFFGSTLGPSNGLDLFRMFWSQVRLQGSTMGNDQEFLDMIQFVGENEITPIVDSVRPFDQIISAFNQMEKGSQMGKLVVTF